MSSQLISIVPIAPLTDEVFSFNQEHFISIRKVQEKLSKEQSWYDLSSRILQQHTTHSHGINDDLPPAVTAVNDTIRDFSLGLADGVIELHTQTATKGVQIITHLEGQLTKVDKALAVMYNILTKESVEEDLQVGKEKYSGIDELEHHLAEIHEELLKVLGTIKDVQGAFKAIHANLTLAKERINNGITDPNQIFAENSDVVREAWKAYEEKRKTMTYLPY
ncbi:hypothetical protein BYT27DRAFT_7217068 [Phlegmacium glaucopus]|nr:hypothetical protein BYT27DRAFT_7217068 [Phlegmacium glaucopus]